MIILANQMNHNSDLIYSLTSKKKIELIEHLLQSLYFKMCKHNQWLFSSEKLMHPKGNQNGYKEKINLTKK